MPLYVVVTCGLFPTCDFSTVDNRPSDGHRASLDRPETPSSPKLTKCKLLNMILGIGFRQMEPLRMS
ncbi:hypothetical protein O181_056790 [Austropuccinia psidii MF-1]|uniref:Uncharacterized protein n=1 Tax=Austropuccinia psidii MF-1 TaxID=1389203 RepID=A0A9Q3HWE6_9BASI|nr:hypothetical protein [Austropuccinia psidii MF-1]